MTLLIPSRNSRERFYLTLEDGIVLTIMVGTICVVLFLFNRG